MFLKTLRRQASNLIKKETLVQVFSCEFCEISGNNFFTEYLQTTASVTANPGTFSYRSTDIGNLQVKIFENVSQRKEQGTQNY